MEINQDKDNMKEFLQKQPHRITMAKHNLGIHQLRIMTRLIEQLQPFMGMNIDFSKPQSDLVVRVKIGELIINNNIKPLRTALDSIMKKIVRVFHYHEKEDITSGGTTEVGMPIIKKYVHTHGTQYVDLSIDGELLPQMLDLARGYTRYNLKIAFNTSSPNVLRLYQFVSHFRDKPQVHLHVDTLRTWLQLENKYAMPKTIKQRILEPAMRELKDKADVWFEIADRITDGRRMKGWKLNIYTKTPSKKTLDKHQHQPDSSPKPKPFGMCSELVSKFKLSERQADKLLQKVDAKDLHKELYQINLLILGGTLKNIGGYTAKMLAEKFNLRL